MAKLIFSIGLVVVGIGIGYLIQWMVRKGTLNWPLETIRKNLQRTALLAINPVAILGATWVANIQDLKIAALPFLGMTALFTGGVLAYLGSRAQQMSAEQIGAYTVCGGFTNIGSLGALFCFIFLGEAGFALVPFYKLFEETLYYAIGFPIAKSFSRDLTRTPSFLKRMTAAVTDIFVLVALGSILTGLVLNFSGIERPIFYAQINAVFIPLAALLLLISIGMAMRFGSVRTYFQPALVITGIKFIIVPVLIGGLGMLLGLHTLDNGLPLKVVLILSSMPVGFIAMVPPTLYKLDIDLANACWLMTNGLLVIIIPWLMFLTRMV